METENARIDSTFLGIEDHGIMTYWLHLSYAAAGQGFGGRMSFAVSDIRKILETVGVSNWESLPGHNIRARHDNQRVYAIGHFMKDQWYSPDEAREEAGGDG